MPSRDGTGTTSPTRSAGGTTNPVFDPFVGGSTGGSGGGGAAASNVNPDVRFYADWNALTANWYDDRSTYLSPTFNASGIKSAAQQLFGQDTLLLAGGNQLVKVDRSGARGCFQAGLNESGWQYVWCYPTSFASVNIIVNNGPRYGGDPPYRQPTGAFLTFTGYTPGPGAVIYETNYLAGQLGGNGGPILRLNDWNMLLLQWDATTRQSSLWADDGAGTMVLFGTSAVAAVGQLGPWGITPVPDPPLFIGGVEYAAAAGGGGTGFGFVGHIGPVKLVLGEGIDLWPLSNFATPAVADASPP